MSLDEQFQEAVDLIRNGKAQQGSATTDEKLKLYGLYKQANDGDVQGARPGMLSFEGRSKWDAWKAVEGKSAEDAKQEYIDEVNRQKEVYNIVVQ